MNPSEEVLKRFIVQQMLNIDKHKMAGEEITIFFNLLRDRVKDPFLKKCFEEFGKRKWLDSDEVE